MPDRADPQSVTCRRCRMAPGTCCLTAGGLIARRFHKIRERDALAIAAHSDPVLDEHFADSGECLVCGVPGLGARHRVVDAIAERLAAGEDPEAVAEDYGCSAGAVAAVQVWMAKWPGAWQ